MASTSQAQPTSPERRNECENFFRFLQCKLSACWQPLATACRFDSDKIKTIRMTNDNPEEQVFDMLCQLWTRSPEGWANLLMKGLEHPAVGRQDVMDDVEQFLRKGNPPLTQMDGNASVGPVTRKRSQLKSAAFASAPQGKCVAIIDINPKMVDARVKWHIKGWKNHMISDEPKVGNCGSYFHCFLTDNSGVTIYTSFFLADSQKCKDVYNAVGKSDRDNQVFLGSLQLAKQKAKYKKKLGTSKYKLVFSDKSEISV